MFLLTKQKVTKSYGNGGVKLQLHAFLTLGY